MFAQTYLPQYLLFSTLHKRACVNGKYSHQILFINFHFLVQTFKLKYTVYKMKLKDTGIYRPIIFLDISKFVDVIRQL